MNNVLEMEVNENKYENKLSITFKVINIKIKMPI